MISAGLRALDVDDFERCLLDELERVKQEALRAWNRSRLLLGTACGDPQYIDLWFETLVLQCAIHGVSRLATINLLQAALDEAKSAGARSHHG